MFKNCHMHLSMKLEGYSFLIRVVLIDWNSESIFRYELHIVKERRKRLIKLRLQRMKKKTGIFEEAGVGRFMLSARFKVGKFYRS